MMHKNKTIRWVKKSLFALFMLVLSLFWAIPLLMILFNAFKSKQEIIVNPNGVPKEFVFSNLTEAFIKGDYAESFFNSFLIMGTATILIILVCASMSYVLARNAKKSWSKVLYMTFLTGMMVPGGLLMTANYKLLKVLHILNTPLAGVCLSVAAFIPLIVFLYTGYINTVPKELDESAIMDGCSPTRVFWQIIFPLLKPVTATAIILVSPAVFNDFLTPLLYMNNVKTVTLSLYNFKSKYMTEWNMIFAGVTISLVPLAVIFLAFQSYFEKGLVAGAVKG